MKLAKAAAAFKAATRTATDRQLLEIPHQVPAEKLKRLLDAGPLPGFFVIRETMEIKQAKTNPYGLQALWENGGIVARAVLVFSF